MLIFAQWGQQAALAAAIGAFLGHVFPVWLRFKGGKGVATFLGTLLGVAWPAGLAFAVIWLGCAALFRYSSLSALVASAASPLVLLGLGRADAALVFAMLAVLLFWKHRENIEKVASGHGRQDRGEGVSGSMTPASPVRSC